MGKTVPFSAVVLAGGESTRIGQDKQFLVYDGQWIMKTIKTGLLRMPTLKDLWIVTNVPEAYDHHFVDWESGGVLSDEYLAIGPIEGIRQGLSHAMEEWVLMVPCDLILPQRGHSPLETFVQRGLALASTCETSIELILWEQEGWIQPLPGFYRRSLVQRINEILDPMTIVGKQAKHSLRRLMTDQNTLIMNWENDARTSFETINTYEDMIKRGGQVMSRNKLTDRTEAVAKIISTLENHPMRQNREAALLERIKTVEAQGRILAEDVFATLDLPQRDKSTMDGYAIAFEPEAVFDEADPVVFPCVAELQMGTDCLDASGKKVILQLNECAYIPTGGLLPEGTQCVVKIEETSRQGDQIVISAKNLRPKQNIIFRGEDCRLGDLVLSKGTVLNAARIGFLALLGQSEVVVRRKPKVVLLTTGDELVGPFDEAGIGQVRDINSLVLSNLIQEAGGELIEHIWQADDEAAIEASILKAVTTADLILSSGASSAGKKDCMPRLMEKLGDQGLVLHGMNVKPGKPLGFATIEGIPFVALPGNPVSSFMTFIWVIEPIFKAWGVLKGERHRLRAVLEAPVAAVEGKETWHTVQLVPRDMLLPVARLVPGKSGLISTVAQSDGCFFVAANQSLNSGDEIEVLLF